MTVTVGKLDARSAAALELVEALDRYLLEKYPPESNHLDSIDELSQAHVHFLGAFEGARVVGCGAVKLLDGYAEIKRIYVAPEKRGTSTASMLLSELENIARSASLRTVRLETGTRQPEALRFFGNCGYARIARFGSYPDDPLSVFMEKTLPPGGA